MAKSHTIPELNQFGISEKTGFLPSSSPLKRLPQYFEPWEQILDNICHLLVSLRLRDRIDQLPDLDFNKLATKPELQRAFLVLCILSHAYVWGAKGQPVLDKIPRVIAKPWLCISSKLRLRPISCHAALVYYNWKVLDESNPSLDLENLATLHTVSGGIDESWFYLITIAIEGVGARAMPVITDALKAIQAYDLSSLSHSLNIVAQVISEMTHILIKMPEHCDPYIFYHRVRIYFSGWSNMKDLPSGVTYEGDEGEIEKMFLEEGEPDGCGYSGESKNWTGPKRYPGGSAAQSALIHALDIFLGIRHFPTGMKKGDKDDGRKINFLKDMRYHMPGEFRDYLRQLELAPSLYHFMLNKPNLLDEYDQLLWSKCVQNYNQCIDNLKQFRDKHIQIVTRYIIIQSQKSKECGQDKASGSGYHGMGVAANKVMGIDSDSVKKVDGKPNSSEPAAGSRGTGGTEIMPFLKQSRDETKSYFLNDS